jgi:hypothetical protein
MTNKISRRNFLKYGAGAALAGLTFSRAGLWLFNDFRGSNQTLANKLLDEFPTEIPGARSINKQKILDADKTLVHIKQVHNNLEISPVERDYVIGVQKDIYQILNHLHETQRIDEVYSEGNFEGKMEYLVQHPELVDLTNINLSLEDKYLQGAEYMLQEEGKMKVIPAETMEGNFLAQDAVKDYENGLITLEERDRLIFDVREDSALKLISKNPNPLNVMLYGGAHNFGDNINQWNSQHPDQKYSLIEITPESYRRTE